LFSYLGISFAFLILSEDFRRSVSRPPRAPGGKALESRNLCPFHVVCEHHRLPAELEPLTSILRDVGGPVTVTVEATLQWTWWHDRLTAAGFTVQVAHPQQVN